MMLQGLKSHHAASNIEYRPCSHSHECKKNVQRKWSIWTGL